MLKDLDPELAEAIQTLLDTFSGGDDSFIDFMLLVQVMDAKAKAGEQAAAQVLAPIKQVARLIRVANRKEKHESNSTGL